MNERRVNKLAKMWQKVYRTVEEETDGTLDRRIGGFITGGKLRGDLITGTPGGGTGEHAANHHKDGSDPISLDLLATVENDTDLVLKPDGNGGVAWDTAPSGGSGGPHAETHEQGGSDEVALDASQIVSGQFADGRISSSSVTQHAPSQSDFDNHAMQHEDGGSDELEISNLATGESDTGLFLRPDGEGGVEWASPPSGNGGGGNGGAETFLDLTDTPADYSDHAGKLVAVNDTEDGLEFIESSGNGNGDGGVSGLITGMAQIEHPDTDVDVLHGAIEAPERGEVQVTPASPLFDASQFWISDLSETTFKINLDAAPGADNTVEFDWMCLRAAEIGGVEPLSVFAHVSNTTGGTSTSITIDVPAHSPGDLLIAQIHTILSTSPATNGDWDTVVTTGASSMRIGTYFRWATESEPSSYTFTAGGADRRAGAIYVIKGANTSFPFASWDSAASGGDSITFSGLSAVFANSILLGSMATANGTDSLPTGFEQLWHETNNTGQGRGGYMEIPDSGTLSPVVFTRNSTLSNFIANAVVISPA